MRIRAPGSNAPPPPPAGLIGKIAGDRALQKAVTWRGVAAVDTLCVATFVLHDPAAAASILGLEQVTKVGQYWLHEKLWSLFRARSEALEGAPLSDVECPKHVARRIIDAVKDSAVTKAITWRIWGSLDTLLLSWLVTGKISTAGAIAGAELITKTLLYVGHEKVWDRMRPPQGPPAPSSE